MESRNYIKLRSKMFCKLGDLVNLVNWPDGEEFFEYQSRLSCKNLPKFIMPVSKLDSNFYLRVCHTILQDKFYPQVYGPASGVAYIRPVCFQRHSRPNMQALTYINSLA